MTTPVVTKDDPPPVTVGSAPQPSTAPKKGKSADVIREEEFIKSGAKEVCW
jgi:hypothetical protein